MKTPIDWRSRACITILEASIILSTPPNQLRKLCRQGKINPITSLGRKWRIATEDIERLLAGRLRNHKPSETVGATMTNNLQREPKPKFEQASVLADVEISNQRFEGYSKKQRQAFAERAKALSVL